MSKILRLNDGSTIEFSDLSTITNLEIVTHNYAEVDDIRARLTEENLSRVEFHGVEIVDVVPISSTATARAKESISARFINGFKAETEIANLKHEVDVLREVNESLSDKAEAADILLGNEEG